MSFLTSESAFWCTRAGVSAIHSIWLNPIRNPDSSHTGVSTSQMVRDAEVCFTACRNLPQFSAQDTNCNRFHPCAARCAYSQCHDLSWSRSRAYSICCISPRCSSSEGQISVSAPARAVQCFTTDQAQQLRNPV